LIEKNILTQKIQKIKYPDHALINKKFILINIIDFHVKKILFYVQCEKTISASGGETIAPLPLKLTG
jgi:hypothetical protein